MAASDIWVQEKNKFGDTFWRNKYTEDTRLFNPLTAEKSVAPSESASKSVQFYPDANRAAGGWEEFFDPNTNRSYWHNRITDETTWNAPKEATSKQPPPPPSLPPPRSYPSPGPLSPPPSYPPAMPSTQAPQPFDVPPSLADMPSGPPSMSSKTKNGPSSNTQPHTPRNPLLQPLEQASSQAQQYNQMPRPLSPLPNPPPWSSLQQPPSSFSQPPPYPPATPSAQPLSPLFSSPPQLLPQSYPPPPTEYTPWSAPFSVPVQSQTSAPSPPPPPPPPQQQKQPQAPLMPNGNKSDHGTSGGDGSSGGEAGSGNRNETKAGAWTPKLEKREQDDWCRRVNALGLKEWYNKKTGTAQSHRPACLRKYR